MKYEFKIDTRISQETHTALLDYMANNNRNKSDAIRLLLVKSLELEKQLKKVQS